MPKKNGIFKILSILLVFFASIYSPKKKKKEEENVFIANSNGMVWMIVTSLHPKKSDIIYSPTFG